MDFNVLKINGKCNLLLYYYVLIVVFFILLEDDFLGIF